MRTSRARPAPPTPRSDDDVGKTVKVRATFTDDAGNEESLTSEATAAIAARPNTPATGAPTIGGTAQVGETLTADTSGIADEDGLENAAFAYQWVAADDADADTDIEGATGPTYEPTDRRRWARPSRCGRPSPTTPDTRRP